jgi:uroporphyrinogen-III synthase
MQHATNILSTRPLSDELLQEAAQRNILIDVISFIDTADRIDEIRDEVKQLYNQGITAIFTSSNAVEAVAALKGDADPRWRIFCIGETTATLAQQHFGENAVAGKALNAQSLANVILRQPPITEVVYFCGDKRRPELPERLSAQGIKIKNVIVYRTAFTPQVIEKKYDAILFFSPSGVESFFSINEIDPDVVLFSIGTTTGEAIKRISGNRIVTGPVTDKDELARHAMAYFTSARTTG